MSNYTQTTDFSAKDALASGDPNKVILGADLDTEFGALQTAVASKLDGINTLTEDTAPSLTGDYVATYDSSGSTHKKVLLSRLAGSNATLVYLSGGSTQVLSSGAWERITCISSEVVDSAGCAVAGKIIPASAVYDGYYLVFGRLGITTAASEINLAITRFNSSNVAQTRKYINIDTPSTGSQYMVFGIHNLTFASGDYIAMEARCVGDSGTIANSTQNELVAFKIS